MRGLQDMPNEIVTNIFKNSNLNIKPRDKVLQEYLRQESNQ